MVHAASSSQIRALGLLKNYSGKPLLHLQPELGVSVLAYWNVAPRPEQLLARRG